ncbi:tyrosine-type recombinase/integrase [Cupriavidus sp. P-10]|uniref:tyrosine-type recombinase/integrase n=1 Tax=Cupriavidus sp. P-10 TaxID=2027911 RepID=UPI000E2F8584|nr:tyrosine-type recombinase/integrase [Cupriavidus sp. P-10]BDB27308.1 tyrosine-type recombinase/integrase [Cupriavidus sp. P-10]
MSDPVRPPDSRAPTATPDGGADRVATPVRRRQRAPVAPTRLLGPHHFAFYRGVLEGVDLARLADRYLDTGRDLRVARATVDWIAGELTRGVRRLATRPRAAQSPTDGHDHDAHHPDAPAPGGAAGIPGMAGTPPPRRWSEAAWHALFHAPAGESAAARQARCQRQQRALEALQPLLAARPAADDAVGGWFTPAIAQRLVAVGWTTLGALQAGIAQGGARWYRQISRIGTHTARRIEAWLAEFATELGAIPPAALVPRRSATAAELASLRPPAAMVAPLEALLLPPALDGRHGHNRAAAGSESRIAAQTDLMAIHAWLGVHPPIGGHTWRAYRTQAERFLLWAVFARGKALSDLTVEDCSAYLAFLADPQPAAQWVGARGTPRYRFDWRPFEGPLSAGSVRQAFTIVKSLCAWLVSAQYLRYNPFALLPKPKAARQGRIQVARSFTETQWQFLRSFATGLPPDDARTARMQFLLRFAYATGLRISEQAQVTVGELRQQDLAADQRGMWTLSFVGKGTRAREVHVPAPVIEALRDYLAARGLGREFERLHPETPLIGRVKADGQAGRLSVAQLDAIWKGFFAQAAEVLATEDPAGAARLAQASAHWLRHTFGSHAIARGVALDVVQHQLGHASLATTSVYVHVEDARRARELDRAGMY